MRKIALLVLPFIMFSCVKKEVKIPTLGEKGIQEIQNHSQVWLFFEVKNNDTIAVVNRKNTISTRIKKSAVQPFPTESRPLLCGAVSVLFLWPSWHRVRILFLPKIIKTVFIPGFRLPTGM